MPEELSNDDLEAIWTADQLLSGHLVEGSWQIYSPVLTTSVAREALESIVETAGAIEKPLSLWLKQEEKSTVAGHELPLGLVTTHIFSARLVEPHLVADRVAAADTGEMITLTFAAANSDTLQRWCGQPEERPE